MVVSIVSSYSYLRIRREDNAHPATSPALADRTWSTPRGNGFCPGDPYTAAVGRYLSVGGVGSRRGPSFCPAFSPADDTGACVDLDASAVGVRVAETCIVLCG